MHVQGQLESDYVCLERRSGAGSESTWEDCKLTLQTDPWQTKAYGNKINFQNNKMQKTMKEKNLISTATALTDPNSQFSMAALTKSQSNKETEKYGPSKGKKKNQQKLFLKDWMADLLDKDF